MWQNNKNEINKNYKKKPPMLATLAKIRFQILVVSSWG
jgi:hypothetical protein